MIARGIRHAALVAALVGSPSAGGDVRYEYDAGGRLVGLVAADPIAGGRRFTYRYDSVGNLLGREETEYAGELRLDAVLGAATATVGHPVDLLVLVENVGIVAQDVSLGFELDRVTLHDAVPSAAGTCSSPPLECTAALAPGDALTVTGVVVPREAGEGRVSIAAAAAGLEPRALPVALEIVASPDPDDVDGDGLPDAWELAYGFDPRYAPDAALDPDGDGSSNLVEYRAGTDPRRGDTDGDGRPDGTDPAPRSNPAVLALAAYLESEIGAAPDGAGPTAVGAALLWLLGSE